MRFVGLLVRCGWPWALSRRASAGISSTLHQRCAGAGTIALTVIAGPLTYVGVNPKAKNCTVPQPSS